ncbi:MAG: DUF86 domain-containing protein [Rudanella sp.]|nr:DUF86 domain-containing protein [Rudanella sp.]
MKGRFGDKQRIEHAIEAITEIEQYIADQTFDSFLANSMMRFACVKQLEIIGEACNHIDVETRNAHPDVEWRKIVGLRNLLIHEYFGVDATLAWDIVQNNLPELKDQLLVVLEGI